MKQLKSMLLYRNKFIKNCVEKYLRTTAPDRKAPKHKTAIAFISLSHKIACLLNFEMKMRRKKNRIVQKYNIVLNFAIVTGK